MTSLRSAESGRPRLRAAASASDSALTVLAMGSLYLIKRISGRFLIGNLDFRLARPYGDGRQGRTPHPRPRSCRRTATRACALDGARPGAGTKTVGAPAV